MKSVVWTVAGIMVIMVGFGLWSYSKIEKTAYVDIDRVFTEFQLSKELTSKLEAYKNTTSIVMDSLTVQLKILSVRIQNSEKEVPGDIEMFRVKREEALYRQQQFEQNYEEQFEQYSTQSMKQLNQYITEFGEKNGYTYIFGAEGSGTLMYAQKQNDITDEVVSYVNNRYEGKNL